MTQAERDFRRAEELKETNSEYEYDSALAAFEMAKAEVLVAEAKLEQAKIAVKEAEVNLGYATITAPIDGVVIDRRVNVGQTVVAGLNAPSLFLLARDLSRMQIWAAVNEADMGDIHVGQHVTFRVDAYREQVFTGTVRQIRLNAGLSNNVVTYGVVVEIDDPGEKLLPYMTASLQFEVARATNVILVPSQALRWRPTRDQITPGARDQLEFIEEEGPLETVEKAVTRTPTIWVASADGLVKPVPVEVGLTDGMVSEVVTGDLRRGMNVVVGVVEEKQLDFVSSFISRVVEKAGDQKKSS
jgi:HlyD family secretion protein